MTIEARYTEVLTQFVLNNKEVFDNLTIYSEKDIEKKSLNFFSYEPKDRTFKIKNIPVFSQLIDDLYEEFINIDGLKFNLKGHHKQFDGRLFKEVIGDEDLYHYTKENILKNIDSQFLLDVFDIYLKEQNNSQRRPVTFLMNNQIHSFFRDHNCDYCDQSMYANLNYETKEIELSDHIKSCIGLVNSDTNVKVELQVPSKKLVFLNDPREFIELSRQDQYTIGINSILGCIKESQLYAEQNVGYFSVGNTSPTIFKGDKDIIVAFCCEEDPEYEVLTKTHKAIDSVCTDLWWYTVLDYDLFISLCTLQDVDIEEIDHFIVDIPSTSCTVVHRCNIDDDNMDEYFSIITFN